MIWASNGPHGWMLYVPGQESRALNNHLGLGTSQDAGLGQARVYNSNPYHTTKFSCLASLDIAIHHHPSVFTDICPVTTAIALATNQHR